MGFAAIGSRFRVQQRHFSGSQKVRQLPKRALKQKAFGQLAGQAGEKMLEVIKIEGEKRRLDENE